MSGPEGIEICIHDRTIVGVSGQRFLCWECDNERVRRERDTALALVERLREVLLAYQQWEAELILDDKAWRGGLPCMTQPVYDRFIEVQGQREVLLRSLPQKEAAR